MVVSEVNGCKYCQAAHTVLGKMNGFSEGDILDLRAGESGNPKLDALVRLAKEIAETKGRVSDSMIVSGRIESFKTKVPVQVKDTVYLDENLPSFARCYRIQAVE